MKPFCYLYTSNYKAKKPICNATQIIQKNLNNVNLNNLNSNLDKTKKQRPCNKQISPKTIFKKMHTNNFHKKQLENYATKNLNLNLNGNFGFGSGSGFGSGISGIFLEKKANLLELKESHAACVKIFQTNSLLDQELLTRTIPSSRCSKNQNQNGKDLLAIPDRKLIKVNAKKVKKDKYLNSLNSVNSLNSLNLINVTSRNPHLDMNMNCIMNSFQNNHSDKNKKEQFNNINQICKTYSNLTSKQDYYKSSRIKINQSLFNSVNYNSCYDKEIQEMQEKEKEKQTDVQEIQDIHQINENIPIKANVKKVSFFQHSIPNNFENEFDQIVKDSKIFRNYINFEEFKLILLKLRFIEKSNIIDNRLSQDLWDLISLGPGSEKEEKNKINYKNEINYKNKNKIKIKTTTLIHVKEILKLIVGISEDKFQPILRLNSDDFPLSINLDLNIIKTKESLFDSKNNLLISKNQYTLIQKYFKSFILKRMFGQNEASEDLKLQQNKLNLNQQNQRNQRNQQKMNSNSFFVFENQQVKSKSSKSRVPILNKSISEDKLSTINKCQNLATKYDCLISDFSGKPNSNRGKYSTLNSNLNLNLKASKNQINENISLESSKRYLVKILESPSILNELDNTNANKNKNNYNNTIQFSKREIVKKSKFNPARKFRSKNDFNINNIKNIIDSNNIKNIINVSTNFRSNRPNQFVKKGKNIDLDLNLNLKSLVSLVSNRNSKENMHCNLIKTNENCKLTSSFQNLSENSSFNSENESTEINEIPIKNIPECFIQN